MFPTAVKVDESQDVAVYMVENGYKLFVERTDDGVDISIGDVGDYRLRYGVDHDFTEGRYSYFYDQPDVLVALLGYVVIR